METLNMKDLDALVSKGRELQAILTESPDILSFLQLLKDTGGKAAVMPTPVDRLIRAGEAAKILCVDKGTIYRYERDGELKAYYTAGSTQKKFWAKEVMALAKPVPVQ